MWVFGYGSLIWKVDFPYEKRIPGYVKGYVRRFWQGSHDHRGTPDNPGRVVTLIPYNIYEQKFKHLDFCPHDDEHDVCWGLVYKVPEEHVESVKRHLDHREKNGYDCFHAQVYTFDPKETDAPLTARHEQRIPNIIDDALIYVATYDNEAFLGPSSLEEMAFHIFKSIGPSGNNFDYLIGLNYALKIIAPHHQDLHIQSLSNKVLSLLENSVHPSLNKKEEQSEGDAVLFGNQEDMKRQLFLFITEKYKQRYHLEDLEDLVCHHSYHNGYKNNNSLSTIQSIEED